MTGTPRHGVIPAKAGISAIFGHVLALRLRRKGDEVPAFAGMTSR